MRNFDLDYQLGSTLSVTSSSILAGADFGLKFYAVDEMGLVLSVTVEGSKYDFYYFPRARQLCVDGEGKGIFKRPVIPGELYTFDITGTLMIISLQAHGFDSSTTDCPGASNLASATFQAPLAELKLSSALASTFSS